MEVVSRQPSLLTSKRGFDTGDAFDAKTEAFGILSGEKRTQEILRQRLESELVNVRGLLRKAKATAVRPPPAPRVKHNRPLPFLAEEPPSKKTKASPPVPVPVLAKAPCVKDSRPGFLAEEPPAKKRKASPPVPVPVPVMKKRKKMTSSQREMLAEDLELFVAEIPDHVVELLEKQSCGIRRDEIEIDIHALEDAALVELQKHIDNFAREKKRRANPSPPQEQHQDQDGMAEEEEEEEEEVDIIGGVSPLTIAPAPLLQLVQEDDEEIDICGGVSPLPILPAPVIPCSSSSPSGSESSSSGSDSDSDSDSECTNSSSDSDSDSDSDEIVDGPATAAERAATPPTLELVARANQSPETQWKEAVSQAREKARQAVLETERTAMPSQTLHHLKDIKALYIDEYNTSKPNNVLPQIGFFLKLEDDEELKYLNFEEHLEEGEIWL